MDGQRLFFCMLNPKTTSLLLRPSWMLFSRNYFLSGVLWFTRLNMPARRFSPSVYYSLTFILITNIVPVRDFFKSSLIFVFDLAEVVSAGLR